MFELISLIISEKERILLLISSSSRSLIFLLSQKAMSSSCHRGEAERKEFGLEGVSCSGKHGSYWERGEQGGLRGDISTTVFLHTAMLLPGLFPGFSLYCLCLLGSSENKGNQCPHPAPQPPTPLLFYPVVIIDWIWGLFKASIVFPLLEDVFGSIRVQDPSSHPVAGKPAQCLCCQGAS